jgi:hypothetical protein
VSTATRGRQVEHEIRKAFVAQGWDSIRGAGSKGEFAEMKPDLVFTRKTHTQLRRAGCKSFVVVMQDEEGNWALYDGVAVQAKLEKEK